MGVVNEVLLDKSIILHVGVCEQLIHRTQHIACREGGVLDLRSPRHGVTVLGRMCSYCDGGCLYLKTKMEDVEEKRKKKKEEEEEDEKEFRRQSSSPPKPTLLRHRPVEDVLQ